MSTRMNRADLAMRQAFLDSYFYAGKMPLSLRYGGADVDLTPIKVRTVRDTADRVTYVYLCKAGILDVTVTAVVYAGHPVVDWSAILENNTDTASAPISCGFGCDASFPWGAATLWHCTGDYASRDGYTPLLDPLTPEAPLTLESGGRPCDTAFPYFRLLFGDERVISGAIGWQGKWKGTFAATEDGASLRAGQAYLDSRLEPGETFKLSSTTLLFCAEGGNARAINLWRSYYMDLILPKKDGRPLPCLLNGGSFDSALEFCFSNEKTNRECYDIFCEEGIRPDTWWLDAGWYDYNIGDEHKDWVRVGTWEYDKARFPAGLAPIADHVHAKGSDFLVWFEPERVHIRTKTYKEHPEWLLTSDKDPYCALLNLGDPDCCDWLIDYICDFMRENHVDIYRQDFNFDPNLFWRDNETEGRIGAWENLHCQGYLRFWDELLRRNPGVLLDSCASGGRRNDIETMKRSVPLHYSDYGYGDLPVKSAFLQTMYEWLPYFKEQPLAWYAEGEAVEGFDDFAHYIGMGPMLSIGGDASRARPVKRADKDGNPFCLLPVTEENRAYGERMRLFISVWREVYTKYCFSDYYEHTEWNREDNKWQIMQFHDTDTDSGMIIGLRFKNGEGDTHTIRLQGCAGDTYTLCNCVTGETTTVAGGTVTLRLSPSAGVLFEYKPL